MSSLIDVRIPAEQSDGTRAQVLRWLKAVGDSVRANEPLLELETDKVTVEIPAPADGVLREILRNAPEDVMPDEVVARLESVAAVPAPAAAVATSEVVTSTAAASRPRLSPAVRRLLAETSTDPAYVQGSGRDGRITATDVLRHARGTDTARVARGAAPTTSALAALQSGVERVPHTATRRRIAERMVESLLKMSPHVTSVFEADLSAVLAHRARHKDAFAERQTPLTLTAYFALATVAAIRAVPEANARWTDDAVELYSEIDLGIATALETRGLVVPVLRGVQSLDLGAVAKHLADLTTRAREDRLTPADVRGGTFTMSNHGVSGSLLAAPIVINPPQTAILGVGKVEKRVVVVERDGEDLIVVRPRAYVTLTIDHRVMDGHRANRFLTTFVDALERWREP